MKDIEEKAQQNAHDDFLEYGDRDTEFFAEKYADCVNKETIILDKFNKDNNLSNDDFYTYFYCHAMIELLSHILVASVLYRLGYEKDNTGMWYMIR